MLHKNNYYGRPAPFPTRGDVGRFLSSDSQASHNLILPFRKSTWPYGISPAQANTFPTLFSLISTQKNIAGKGIIRFS